MKFPTRLTIFDYQYFLDGGTTVLLAADENGNGHTAKLVQHAFPQSNPSPIGIPGRIYFDGELLPMRSDQEARLLALLRVAEFRYAGPIETEGERYQLSPNSLILGDDLRRVMMSPPGDNIPFLLTEAIRFVESDEYFRFAERVDKAADESRYTVWPAWDSSTRSQMIVRLGSYLGIGIPAAREVLLRNAPLGEDLGALEVADMADRYAAAGIALRVEPSYRWALPQPR